MLYLVIAVILGCGIAFFRRPGIISKVLGGFICLLAIGLLGLALIGDAKKAGAI